MIVYEATKEEFCDSVFAGSITEEIHAMFIQKLGHDTSPAEISSWQNSMQYMYNVLNDSSIPDNCGVAIEFKIPHTSNRVDFIITGLDQFMNDSVVIIELKQWSKVEKLEGLDGVVKTFIGGKIREKVHPSYQAWTYSLFIQNFNETVETEKIGLYPLAYLHNYNIQENDPLIDKIYEEYYTKAPIFGQKDASKLRKFIKKYMKHGDNTDILYRIDNGNIRPSKKLQDTLSSMLGGNQEFLMIDEQKIAYEMALMMVRDSYGDNKKRVLIVEGGPGTGKTVIAINLLVQIMNYEMNSLYVTKNSAPRNVFFEKLKGKNRSLNWLKTIFKSSGSFTKSESNDFDAIIVDEAHRLNEKSGLFSNLGENQIKEIINASKFSVFFIDRNQRVSLKDYGSVEAIYEWAFKFDADIKHIKLVSQFRCNGSDGYLSWLDDVLEIEQTANFDGFGIDYDFRVIDDVCELRDLIFEKNEEIDDEKLDKTYDARLLAGYCWNWDKEERANSEHHDIKIDDFEMSWNLNNTETWAIDEDSINEVGCIHTSQGLEFDYVGVIIGNDMRFENGHIVTDFNARAKTDQSLKGIKKFHKENPEEALKVAEKKKKNTYRTLMTRGMKGCYIYCEDMALQAYFKDRLEKINLHDKLE